MEPTEKKSPTPGLHSTRRDLKHSPLRLSPSSIAIFQQCPRQYKFRYIDKLATQYFKPRAYFTMGNHIHAALKDFLSIVPELRTPDIAKEFLLKNWASSHLGFKDSEDEKHWFNKASRQVEAFALSPYATGNPLMLEAPMEALISPGVMLYGRVDRVDQEPDGRIHIIDYKTGKEPSHVIWTQLQLQSLILSFVLPASIRSVSFLYLDGCHLCSREVSSAYLAETRWEFLGIASKIRRERGYPPRPGVWCKGCDFESLCSTTATKATPLMPTGQLPLWGDFSSDIDLKRLGVAGTGESIDFGKATSNALDTASMPSAVIPAVNQELFLAEKIRLFRSLFYGRQDVFARLWQSKQSGKVGYSPVCNHEWDPIFCGKPRVKCSECPNREFTPITDTVIQNHLEGKHTVGIYPLFPDETCYLLALDFDKQSWMDDAAAFLETCHHFGIPSAIERSRSGNGAHVWIFFAQAVSASTARKLGCYLVTETMAHRHQLGMDSYDRLFPNQDTVPKGGLGNLIALPLQKGPAERGNTLFLDKGLNPYQDQWAFLSSVGRMEPSALEEVVRRAVKSGQVIGVSMNPSAEEDQPWAMTPSREPRGPLLVGPFPSKVKVVIGNLIYVEKEGLSSPLLNRIKRLAAFQNPEFYKRQSIRLSTSLTPRVIYCAEEFPLHLGIPRGCLNDLQQLLESVNIKLELIEERFQGKKIEVIFQGNLTPAQEAATSDLMCHDNGVLVAPSGLGKTVVGINIIAARGVNTLVLVHRRPLLEQWRSQLAKFLKVDPMMIGQFGGGKNRRSGYIDVAMLQSLVRKGQVEDVVAEYGQVIVDECHHLPAVTFEQVLRQVKARYVMGLTATPYRRDGHQPIILMQCGPIRHSINQKDSSPQGLLRYRLIRRDTNFTLSSQNSEPNIHDIYTALVADEARNQLILDDLLQALKDGRSPILLTERREHLEFFASKLTKSVRNVVILRGGMGSRQRRAVAEQLATIPVGGERVLLATGRYIGEGFDDARLDTLFLAMPVSWKGTLMQYAGRLHRLYAGKTEVRTYDYVDCNNPMLLRMFQKRLRGYRAIGYELDKIDSSTDKIP